MPKVYGKNDIIKFDEINSEIAKLSKNIEGLHTQLVKISKIDVIKKGNGSDLKQLESAQKSLTNVQKENIKIQKRAAKLAADRTLGIQKQKQALQLEASEVRKVAKAEVLLQHARKRGIKSIQDMKKQISALNTQRERENLTTKQGVKNYKKLTAQIAKTEKNVKKYDKAIGRSQRNVGNYGSKLKNLGATFGIVFGARVVIDFFKDSLKGYEAQVIAEKKLETVLKQRTGATEEQIQRIKDLTTEQQKLGVIGDEIQIAGAQQLSTFVNQTSSIETLIPAVNNLIAQQKGLNATEGDAVNIANLVGKALQGQVGALSRVGITFSEAEAKVLKFGTEEERAAALAEILTNNVGKANKALSDTPTGKMKQLSNIFGDIQEKIGAELSGVLFKIAIVIKEVIDVLSGPNSLSDAFKEIGNLFKGLFKSMGKLISAFQGTNAEALTVRDVINGIGKALNFALGPMKALIRYTGKLIDFFTFYIKKGREVLVMMGLLKEATEDVSEENISWIPTAEAVAEGMEKIKVEAEELTAKQKDAAKAAAKLREENNKLVESLLSEETQLKDVSDALKEYIEEIETSEKAEKNRANRIQQEASNARDIAIANFKKDQAQERINNAEFETSQKLRTQVAKEQADELFIFKTEKDIKYLQFVRSQILLENSARAKGLDAQIVMLQASLAEFKNKATEDPDGDSGDDGKWTIWSALGLTEKQAEQANQILEITKNTLTEYFDTQIQKYSELADASRGRQADIQAELDEEIKRNDAGAASRIDSLKKQLAAEKEVEAKAKQEREKAAKRKKQIAITESIIGTAVAVVNSLKEGGILGILLAAVVAAAGAIQISKIKNSKFAEGTEYLDLNGNPKGTDTIPAMANGHQIYLDEGERIFSKRQNASIPKGMSNELATEILSNYGKGVEYLDGKNSFAMNHNNVILANNKILERNSFKTNQLLTKISQRPIDLFNKEGRRIGYRVGENTYYTG